MSARVFVVNEPMFFKNGEWVRAVDLSAAREWGEVIHILPAGNLADDIACVTEQIKLGMASFTEDDYVLLIGDPRAMAMVAAIAADVGDGRFKMLHWLRGPQCYNCVEVSGLFDDVQATEDVC